MFHTREKAERYYNEAVKKFGKPILEQEDNDCSNCPVDEINNIIEDYFMDDVSEDDYEISPIEAMSDDEYTDAFTTVITDICEKIGHCNCFYAEDDAWFYHE